MDFNDYQISTNSSSDITGVLMFLAVAYGNYGNDREHKAPYYRRKDKRLWRY